jgi:hypothetical protein
VDRVGDTLLSSYFESSGELEYVTGVTGFELEVSSDRNKAIAFFVIWYAIYFEKEKSEADVGDFETTDKCLQQLRAFFEKELSKHAAAPEIPHCKQQR